MSDQITDKELSQAVTAYFAAKDAVRTLEDIRVRTVQQEMQLRYCRAQMRQRRRELNALTRRAQMRLPF